MAVAFVREVASGNNGTSSVLTLVLTVGAAGAALGDLVVVYAVQGGSRTLSSVSDSRGNTWTVAKTLANGSSHGTAIASSLLATALVSGDTITLTWSGTGRGAGIALEFSGLASSPFDVAAGGTGAATPYASGLTATSAGADNLIIGAVSQGAALVTITPEALSPAWTEQDSIASVGSFTRSVHALWRIVADGPTTYEHSGTFASSQTYVSLAAVYKAAAGGGGAALAGTVAGMAAATGSPTTAIALVGTAIGVAATAGSPATSIALAASAGGAAAVGGALSTGIRLAGVDAGIGSAAGSLTTRILPVGSSIGVASTSASLGGVAAALAGAVAGMGAAQAQLATGIALVGWAQGQTVSILDPPAQGAASASSAFPVGPFTRRYTGKRHLDMGHIARVR